MAQLCDQTWHGKGKKVRAEFDKVFKEHRNTKPDREALILEQLSAPGKVTGLLAHHGDDIVDMPQREKIGDDLPQLLIADLWVCLLFGLVDTS